MTKNLREESRKNLVATGDIDTDLYKLGCLQRIADATEKMAIRYRDLIDDNDYLRRRLKDEQAACKRLLKSNAALRGHIKRLKKI